MSLQDPTDDECEQLSRFMLEAVPNIDSWHEATIGVLAGAVLRGESFESAKAHFDCKFSWMWTSAERVAGYIHRKMNEEGSTE